MIPTMTRCDNVEVEQIHTIDETMGLLVRTTTMIWEISYPKIDSQWLGYFTMWTN